LEIYTMSTIDAFQGRYNLRAWKENWKLIKEKEAFQNQIRRIEEELTLDAELAKEEANLLKEDIQLEEKIKILKKLIEELIAKLKQKEIAYQQTRQKLE